MRIIRKVLVWLNILPAQFKGQCEHCAYFKKARITAPEDEASCFMGHDFDLIFYNSFLYSIFSDRAFCFEPNIKPCPDYTHTLAENFVDDRHNQNKHSQHMNQGIKTDEELIELLNKCGTDDAIDYKKLIKI